MEPFESEGGRALALSTIVVLSMVVPFVGALAGPAAGQSGSTLVVDDDGTGDHTSIQAAVDNASADGTVVVESGRYEESVTVDVPGLSLVGPNAGRPGYGNRTAEATIDGRVVIAADGVVLDGFDVSPPPAESNAEGEALRIDGGPDDVVAYLQRYV